MLLKGRRLFSELMLLSDASIAFDGIYTMPPPSCKREQGYSQLPLDYFPFRRAMASSIQSAKFSLISP